MITLINCFEVPEGRDEAFLALFREVNTYMRGQPGYRSHRLHSVTSPDSRYRFINVVEWESKDQLDAARDEHFRSLVGKPEWREFRSTPHLCQAIHEGGAAAVSRVN